MNFSHPWVLYFLWLLPLMAFAFIAYERERRKAMERFAEPELLQRLSAHVKRGDPFLRAVLCVAAFGLMILALAGPRWGSHYQEVHQKGVDIMVLLDVSPSMGVEDVKPNRLKRAKREIQDLLKNVRGDRVGLVVFSGAAFTQCPLTLDYGALRMFLNAVEPGLVPVPGTDLGAAIHTGISAFNPEVETDKVMLLITDGEDNEKQGIKAAREAAKKGIKIFVFGMGDPAGGPIPLPGDEGGFKKDEKGNLILSKLNEEELRQIAAITGGAYVRSVAGDLDLDLLYFDGIKSKTADRTLKSGKIKVYEERFSLFLIAAFILLLFEALLGRLRGPGFFHTRTQAAKTTKDSLPVLGMLTVFMGASTLWYPSTVLAGSDPDKLYKAGRYQEAEALYAKKDMDNPKDIRYRYNRGCAGYQQEAYKGSMAAFASVLKRAQDQEARFKAAFNAGNAAFKQGDFRSAKNYYTQAIVLNPENPRAKHNLELTLRKLAQQKQSQEGQKKPDQKPGGNQQKAQSNDSKERSEPSPKPSQDRKDEQEQKGKKSDSSKDTQEAESPQQTSQGSEQEKPQQPRDLSGDLQSSEPLPDQTEKAEGSSQVASMAKKKAEALLDNVNENQAKFLKFRLSPSRKEGVPSGKDW